MTGLRRMSSGHRIPVPSLSLSNKWCIGVTVAPDGWAWNRDFTSGSARIVSNYAGALANVIVLYADTACLKLLVGDSSGGVKLVTWTHSWTDSRTARLVGCNNGGTLSLYADGVSVGTASGAGTGLHNATLSPLAIAAPVPGDAAFGFTGPVRNVKVYTSTGTYRAGM